VYDAWYVVCAPEHVQSVESAKTPETRQRRIGKSIDMLRQRQAR
jgi:uncharacterized protein YdeI (YjbR/CyaY-like superfamily)